MTKEFTDSKTTMLLESIKTGISNNLLVQAFDAVRNTTIDPKVGAVLTSGTDAKMTALNEDLKDKPPAPPPEPAKPFQFQ